MNEYATVFDLAEAGYRQWTFPAFGLIFVFIGTVMTISRLTSYQYWPEEKSFLKRIKQRYQRILPYWMLIFSILWIAASFIGTFGEYYRLRKAFDSRNYEVVEGKVEQFIPMPYEGHANESFAVGGKHFQYSDFHVTAGFNNTKSHGGPINEGRYVRISHIGNAILKLEVQQGNR